MAGLVFCAVLTLSQEDEDQGADQQHVGVEEVREDVEGADLAAVEESKDYLLSGVVDYEFRTTVVKGLHTEQSLRGAAEWIRGAKAWFLQQYKDSGNIIENYGLSAFSDEEMRSLCKAVQEIIPVAALRGVE